MENKVKPQGTKFHDLNFIGVIQILVQGGCPQGCRNWRPVATNG
jgi:hypothetical protein